MTAFAGFEMPLYYKDIAPEHLAVRNSVGIFDISHMGRVIVSGPDSERFLNYVVTNDVSTLLPNDAQYSVMCTEKGGIVDDFVVYRLEKARFLVVFNAGNREKDFSWLAKNRKDYAVNIDDVSDNVAMFAVQGPKAESALQKICNEDLSKIGRFKCCSSQLAGVRIFLARTGYTGEDGFEVFVWNASVSNPGLAEKVWTAILEAGKDRGMQPCGLGARDTLRLEAGLCLYGNDIDETRMPIEAGLSFVVKLQKESFIGKETLLEQKKDGPKWKRVGVVMLGRGIPRPDFGVYSVEGERKGQLTSGTFSPLLKTGIGMGYVEPSQSLKDTPVDVDIRGKMARARVSAFPLYDPEKYGYRRKMATA
jgi:aminomethyltransferase